jgi:hypothetical protein
MLRAPVNRVLALRGRGLLGAVGTRIVSIRHLCSCLSHVLFSADLVAMGSCCLILTGRPSPSLTKGENQPLAEMADPLPLLSGPSAPVKGRKLCFLRSLLMVCSLAKSCDAAGTPPGLPTQHRKGPCVIYIIWALNGASFSY